MNIISSEFFTPIVSGVAIASLFDVSSNFRCSNLETGGSRSMCVAVINIFWVEGLETGVEGT